MKNPTLDQVEDVVDALLDIEIVLDDLEYPIENEFYKYIRTKYVKLKMLQDKMEKAEAFADANREPLWYDKKTNTHVRVCEMHTYHILNAKRAMKHSYWSNRAFWIDLFDKE